MDNTWLILVVVVAAAAYFLYDRQRRPARNEAKQKPVPSGSGDFTADRESSRLAGMSEEDRAWEQASLSKDQHQEGQAAPASAPLPGRDGNPQV